MQKNSNPTLERFNFSYTPWKTKLYDKDGYPSDKKRHCDLEIYTDRNGVVVIATEPDEGLPLRARLWNFSDMAFQLYLERFRHTATRPKDMKFFRRPLKSRGRDRLSPVLFRQKGNFTKPLFVYPLPFLNRINF